MSVIKVRCIDQVMTLENTPVIAAGGMEENQAEFNLCGQWDGYAVTAVFWRKPEEAYHAVLDEFKTCTIPWEVLTTEGLMYFGIFGVNAAEQRRTSNVLNYRIVAGAITEDTQPSEPTPTIYDQLLAQFALKADRVLDGTEGHFPTLDHIGNLQDSGKKPQDFVEYTPDGRLSYEDAEGNRHNLLPKTSMAQVDGLGGAMAKKADLDETGKVPGNQLPSIPAALPVEVTLTAAAWAEAEDGLYYQTAAVAQAQAHNVVIVAACPDYLAAYSAAMIRCTAQADGSLTFCCDDVPDTDIVANVIFMEVKEA